MFKYVKFTKVETEFTVLEFRGGDDTVKVNHFDVDVVSLESENESDIDELINSQAVDCTVITQDEFKAMVVDSSQLKRIRQIVKEDIAVRYDIADEIAMSKRSEDDPKRVAYDAYIQKCLSIGYGLKAEIGY